MNYWEFIKERWKENIAALSELLPIIGMFGWVVPIILAIWLSVVNEPLGFYLFVTGGIWFFIVIGYLVVEHERDSYKDWKETYEYNHNKKPSNADEKTGDRE